VLWRLAHEAHFVASAKGPEPSNKDREHESSSAARVEFEGSAGGQCWHGVRTCTPMRVAVIGATGNVGTSVLRALARDPEIRMIKGIARRLPAGNFDKTEFHAADITSAPLLPLLRGMDAVIHLAWRIQSAHDPDALERANVHGSQRVFEAVAQAGVPILAYSSSIGVYSKGPKDQAVDETWLTDGIPTSLYSRQKVTVERLLDAFELKHPALRCVRMRPTLIFKRDAGTEIRRLFMAPWWPGGLFSPSFIRLIPYHPRLRFQTVHSFDVGEAFRLALKRDVRGAFNLASDQVLSSAVLAAAFNSKQVPISHRFLRRAAAITWRLRLQHSDPGWVDLGLDSPVLDASRARDVLGWAPTRTSLETLFELLQGISEGAGLATPPLAPPFKVQASTRAALAWAEP
jgi:UDP-glucose 4-epimerase